MRQLFYCMGNLLKSTVPKMLKRCAMMIVLCVLLSGCAPSTIEISTSGAIASFKNLPNSRKAPCQIQRAIAAHNSVYDTLKTGKERVYKAPCDVERTEAKTS